MNHVEAVEIAVAEMDAVSEGRVSPIVSRTPGLSAYWTTQAIAVCMTELSHQHEESYAHHFLDTSQGQKLQELAHDRHNMQIEGATAAVATLTFTRVDTTDDHTIAAGTIIRTPSGIRFSLDADLNVPSGSASASGVATSTLAGKDQEAAAGTITIPVSTLPATDYTVTNAERAAGGNDLESEESFRTRVRERDEAAPGTLAGIRHGAITAVPEIREAAAFEVLDAEGRPAGDVSLVVSDEAGQSNSAMETAADVGLDEYRAAGIPVIVSGAVVEYIDIAAAITWEPGAATPERATAAESAVLALVNIRDANGADGAADAPESCKVSPGLIEHAIRSVGRVVGVNVLQPVGEIAPDRGIMLRTTRGRITLS